MLLLATSAAQFATAGGSSFICRMPPAEAQPGDRLRSLASKSQWNQLKLPDGRSAGRMAFGFGFNKAKVLNSAEKHVQQGKIQNAINDYEKVLQHEPKDLAILNTLGDLYARMGDPSRAASYFKKVGDAYAAEGFTVKPSRSTRKSPKLTPRVWKTSAGWRNFIPSRTCSAMRASNTCWLPTSTPKATSWMPPSGFSRRCWSLIPTTSPCKPAWQISTCAWAKKTKPRRSFSSRRRCCKSGDRRRGRMKPSREC